MDPWGGPCRERYGQGVANANMDFCRLNGVSFCTSRTMTMRGHRPGPLDRAWLKINGNGFLTRQIHLFKQPNQTAKILNQKAASPIYHQNIASRLAARCARVVERTFRPDRPDEAQGRAGCRVPDAPAALCAKKGSTSAHKSSQRRHRKTRQSRTRWFTDYTVLSSGRCSLRPSSRGLRFCLRPVGPTSLRRT